MMLIRQWPAAIRRFIFIYMLITTTGLMIGLAFVRNETDLSSAGIREHYNGTDPQDDLNDDIKFEKSAKDLLLTTHNHILGLSSVFFITAALFWFTGWFSETWRLVIMAEPLVALVTTFGGIWVLRFIPGMEWITWFIMLSGLSMFVTFGLMSVAILTETIRKGKSA